MENTEKKCVGLAVTQDCQIKLSVYHFIYCYFQTINFLRICSKKKKYRWNYSLEMLVFKKNRCIDNFDLKHQIKRTLLNILKNACYSILLKNVNVRKHINYAEINNKYLY